MCKEIFKLLQSMDLAMVENKMALQCAPVITGIKISNLLIISSEDEGKVHVILMNTGIMLYRLFHQNNKTIFLLFRRSELSLYLQQSEVQKVLKGSGYRDLSFEGILRLFQYRYKKYMEQRKDFPHEMGLLLGYPIEDVMGFIEQKGKNYLYSGYWKVYKDVAEKKKLFSQYENAKEELILWMEYGYEIRSIIQLYCI